MPKTPLQQMRGGCAVPALRRRWRGFRQVPRAVPRGERGPAGFGAAPQARGLGSGAAGRQNPPGSGAKGQFFPILAARFEGAGIGTRYSLPRQPGRADGGPDRPWTGQGNPVRRAPSLGAALERALDLHPIPQQRSRAPSFLLSAPLRGSWQGGGGIFRAQVGICYRHTQRQRCSLVGNALAGTAAPGHRGAALYCARRSPLIGPKQHYVLRDRVPIAAVTHVTPPGSRVSRGERKPNSRGQPASANPQPVAPPAALRSPPTRQPLQPPPSAQGSPTARHGAAREPAVPPPVGAVPSPAGAGSKAVALRGSSALAAPPRTGTRT